MKTITEKTLLCSDDSKLKGWAGEKREPLTQKQIDFLLRKRT
jgi:hypothetical protein